MHGPGHCRGASKAPYDATKECRVCWLALNGQGPAIPQPRPATRKAPPVCLHLGPVLTHGRDPLGKEVKCAGCFARKCEVHGTCTTGKPYSPVACCGNCQEYEPDG